MVRTESDNPGNVRQIIFRDTAEMIGIVDIQAAIEGASRTRYII